MSGVAVQIAQPIGGRRQTIEVPEGETLSGIVARAALDGVLDGDELGRLRTYVNQTEVAPEDRDSFTPMPGDYVLLYPTPQVETVAEAITAIVAALAPASVTAAITSAFGITSLAAAQAIFGLVALTESAALSAGLGMIARALGGGHSSGASTYGISGASNTADPDGICPVILGKRRVVPKLAASTWTETVGDDVYLRMLVQWHVGPCRLSDLKIGETPLGNFDDVEVQHRLLPTDPFPSNYNRVVREDTYGSLQLVHDNGWVQRQTQVDTTEISIDLAWPNGLAWNGKDPATLWIQFQYRPIDTTTWIDAPVGTGGVTVGHETTPSGTGFIRYYMTKAQPFRRNISWAVPKGQYDVRILRVTDDAGNSAPRLQDAVYWTCMRSFGEGLPVIGDNFALTCLRIRASNQLNGQIAELNGVVEALIPTWDAEAGDFTGLDASSNPGDQLNWVARGPANARPLTDRVNVANHGAFAQTCTAKGWKCDTIIETEMSVEQAMTLVALSGHALGTPWEEGRLTVSIDNERPAPAQLFSGRNVANFAGTIIFPEPLHAVNVSFYDAASGYQKEVRTVYADGYDASSATAIEAIHTDTKTDAAEAHVYGWRYLQSRTHRPETYEWDCDREGMVATWGSRVDVAHPRMLVGIRGTRIKQVLTRPSDGYVTGFVVDEIVPMEAGTSYALKPQRGSSIGLLLIVTVAGLTSTLTVVTPAPPNQMPVVGNHCVFGVAGKETLQTLVTGIAQKADQTVHLTSVPYAPELLADGGTIPPWDPMVTARAMAEPIATGHVPPVVRRSVDDETLARLANNPVTPGSVGVDELKPEVADALALAAQNIQELTASINETIQNLVDADAGNAANIQDVVESLTSESGALQADYLSRFGVVTTKLAAYAYAVQAVQAMFGNDYSAAVLRMEVQTPPDGYLAKIALTASAGVAGATGIGGMVILLKEIDGDIVSTIAFIANQTMFLLPDGTLVAQCNENGLYSKDNLVDGTVQKTYSEATISSLVDIGAFTAPSESYLVRIPSGPDMQLFNSGHDLDLKKFAVCRMWAYVHSTTNENTHYYIGIVGQRRDTSVWEKIAWDQGWFNSSGSLDRHSAQCVIDGNDYKKYGVFANSDWQAIEVRGYSFTHDVRDW